MNRDTEGSLQHWVSAVLRFGVVLAAAIGALGGVYYLIRHGSEPVAYHTFTGDANPNRLVGEVFKGVLAFRARSIMQLGALVLIATPVARVFVSLLGFVKEKDRTYVVITLIVLLTLLGSIVGGAIRG